MGKKDVEKVESLGFNTAFSQHVTNLGGNDPDDRWTRDSTSSTWSFERIFQCTSGYPDVTIPEPEYDAADQFWFVYAIHSSGDSFGHDEANYKTDVGLYSSRDMADKIATLIRKHADDYCRYNGYRVSEKQPKEYEPYSVKLPDGQTIHAAWNG